MAKKLKGDMVQIIRDMDAAREHIDKFPSDREWSDAELTEMDDVRHAAMRLNLTAEAAIEELTHGKKGKIK